MRHITDGSSNTLLAGEINYAFEDSEPLLGVGDAPTQGVASGFAWAQGYWLLAWGHMASTAPKFFNNNDNYGPPITNRTYRSDHPEGVHFAVLDGSVRMLTDDSDPEVRRALVTRAGEEIHHR